MSLEDQLHGEAIIPLRITLPESDGDIDKVLGLTVELLRAINAVHIADGGRGFTIHRTEVTGRSLLFELRSDPHDPIEITHDVLWDLKRRAGIDIPGFGTELKPD